MQEEAAKRDHRLLGKQQQLFMTDPLSPGSVFFLNHGTRILNKLQALLRSEYVKRGFDEVITPVMYNVDLWKKSGHWDNYRDDMFSVIGCRFVPPYCVVECIGYSILLL
jgi:threonyl-tRNA synthetase